MATIAPSQSATIGQIAKVVQILEREQIAGIEFQRFIDDFEYRASVILGWRPDDVALIEMPEVFDAAAIQLLLRNLFPNDWRNRNDNRRQMRWDENPFESLASTAKVKAMMVGLTNLQQAIVVLRSGLIDGKVVSAVTTADRLGISTKQLNMLRGDASRLMKRRAVQMGTEKLRAARESAREAYLQEHINDLPLNAAGVSVRLYSILSRNGMNYLGEVAERSRDDLLDLRNMGTQCITELDAVMQKHGLSYRQG